MKFLALIVRLALIVPVAIAALSLWFLLWIGWGRKVANHPFKDPYFGE